jgi:uncharacterized membrane protein
MTTPILMMLILTLPVLIARMLPVLRRRTAAAAATGLGLLFLFTASGHFVQTREMTLMLPPWVPAREALVYLSGVLEIAVAVGFFVPRWRPVAGWCAAAMLVAFFPVNVYAAIQHVPMGGHAWGPVYLLIRGPLQLFILGWLWYFMLREGDR